jgi:hypothetical protein
VAEGPGPIEELARLRHREAFLGVDLARVDIAKPKGEVQFEFGWRLIEKAAGAGVAGAVALVAPKPAAKIFAGSFAEPFEEAIRGFLPKMSKASLLASHHGCDKVSLGAFLAAAPGQTCTMVFIAMTNGNSICGGYLHPAWRNTTDAGYIGDAEGKSFIFTLRNHLGVPPTKFEVSDKSHAALLENSPYFTFGGCDIRVGPSDHCSNYPDRYANPLGHGGSLFAGEGAKGRGSANLGVARWELWKIA